MFHCVKLFLLLNLFAKVFIICSDSTEVEGYQEEYFFDLESDLETFNLFEQETSFDSETESFPEVASFIDRVRISFNLENDSIRNRNLELDQPIFVTERGNNFLRSSSNNYRNLAQDRLIHQPRQNWVLNYRNYPTYNAFTGINDRVNGPCYRTLFVFLIFSFALAVVTLH